MLAFDGCYDARRTAALSGVPRSTVYDWARKGIVVPSISPEREKLWSYADLMALRTSRGWVIRRCLVTTLDPPRRCAPFVLPLVNSTNRGWTCRMEAWGVAAIRRPYRQDPHRS